MNTARRILLCLICLTIGNAALAADELKHYAVPVDGVTLAVYARASDHPRRAILLLHGRTWSALPDFDLQTSRTHRSVMLALSRAGFAAYAMDLRGYGRSPRNADGWNTPNQAAHDVAVVLAWVHARHPKLGAPTLLGWSMGSMIAQLTAQRYPDALSDLILYGYPHDPAAAPIAAATPAEPPREINTRERAMSDFISPAVISQTVIDDYVAAALKADPVRADWQDLDQYAALDPAKVQAPTLLIHGSRDPLAPVAAQARLFAALVNPDRQWVVVPGGDHAAMLEATHDAFIAAVVAFLNRPIVGDRMQ